MAAILLGFNWLLTPMRSLEQTWRWFGPTDPIPLPHVRQAGATGIVTALHHIPNGAVWPVSEIQERKDMIERAGLTWSVVESVPVHEAIKQALPNASVYLENYAQSLHNLAQCGIRSVCYNFMPLLDWTRTNLAWILPNGAEALRFDIVDAALFDLLILKRPQAANEWSADVISRAEERFKTSSDAQKNEITRTILLGLPGTVDDMTVEEFQVRLNEYREIDSDKLRANLGRFLSHVIPVAAECGVVMAIHPDDPPFPIFGLPRVASTLSDFEKLLALVDLPANGITFCTGSLGAHPKNDLPEMFRRLAQRVHFLHLRNVKREADGSFFEDDHLAGSTDMAAVMCEIVKHLGKREPPLPMRPDHGHRMLGDLEKTFYGGYSAIGRLKGLAELRGLEVGIQHVLGKI